ncbi:aminotransferase class V-fold PLP-dependent enzyme [Clostridium niameyense]|uniref:aminotransferase class V-fold PLP-dependent enzyme n=1 Tax=Clostridium niameyense TaxID=1622073 RepID=UPI00067E7766|nr:aminotransferase class V-fold PLP-dependent enzyme [Clostridium niameyense]
MNFIKNSPYKYLVVGVDTKIPINNNKLVTAINFDNSATTPAFVSVMEEIFDFAPWYSSIHRGTGYKSQLSSEIYEKSKNTVANFIGADLNYDTIIYVKNTTEAINKLSYRLCSDDPDSIVLATSMEHHSNDLPWRGKYNVDYIEVDNCGRLVIEDLKQKLIKYQGKVKLVTVTGASNVTGYKNPIYYIASLVHQFNAKLLVDGAQLVPHCAINMKPHNDMNHIDYLAFSAHKMYAPFGIGVLVGPKSTFEAGDPEISGGGTVKTVTKDFVIWKDPPEKEEAGTPNLMGVVALTTAINTLNKLGMNNIERYEQYLLKYTINKLKRIPDIELYSHDDNYPKVSIIPFNIKGIHHSVTAEILSKEAGIAVRSGCFCAQPYVQRLLNISEEDVKKYAFKEGLERPGMVRISFGMYNDCYEIDRMIYSLKTIVANKKFYIKRYGFQ